MKKILILLIFITSTLVCQIPTINAIGGGGKNINWETIKKEKLKDINGPDFFYFDCGESVSAIRASSTLAPSGNTKYNVTNLTDDDPMTAWVEGVKGYGIGEWFEVKAQQINGMYNGYQSSPQNWLNNSRVKKFKVYKNNKPLCFLILTDEMDRQYFELPDNNFLNDTTFIFKFEIVEVYKGLKWDDVCISHITDMRCCFSENTFINGNDKAISITDIKKENEILVIDIEKNLTSNTKVQVTTTQKHLSLFKLTTATKKIEVTFDHPLYFKSYGFSSISRLLKHIDLNSIIDTIEIMTWNDSLKKTEYEKITNLEKITGVFNTYTILKLEKGNTYIANGFITKTY